MTLNSFMPVKLVTGLDCVRASAKEFAKLGEVCLIVTGKHSARASGALQDVTDTLDSNGQRWVLFDEIGQNPRLTDCMAAAEQAIAAVPRWMRQSVLRFWRQIQVFPRSSFMLLIGRRNRSELLR